MSNTDNHRKRLALMLALLVLILTMFLTFTGNNMIILYNDILGSEIQTDGQAAESLHNIKTSLRNTLYAVIGLMIVVIYYGVYLLFYIRKLKMVVYRDVLDEFNYICRES